MTWRDRGLLLSARNPLHEDESSDSVNEPVSSTIDEPVVIMEPLNDTKPDPVPLEVGPDTRKNNNFISIIKQIGRDMNPFSSPVAFAQSVFPITVWLPKYKWKENFLRDALAGITLAVVVVPKSMAHALLANVDPIDGLYTVLFATLVYFFMGGIRYMSVSTAALPAILFGEAIGIGGERLAPMLTLWIGLFTLLIVLFKLDQFVSFVAPPAFSAILSAAAFLISTTQVRYLFGIHDHVFSQSFVLVWGDVIEHINKTDIVSVVFGVGGIMFLLLSKRLAKKFLKPRKIPDPGTLVLAIISVSFSYALDLQNTADLDIVGSVNVNLAPSVPWSQVTMQEQAGLMRDGAIISLVNFLLFLANARLFAVKAGLSLSIPQEVRSIGSVNVVSSFFNGFVAGGSFVGSALLASIDATSMLPNIVASIVTVLFLVGLSPALAFLPKATLAAIIISAIPQLIDFGIARKYLNTKPTDFSVWLITFLVTLFAGVRVGLVIGLIASLLALTYSTTRNEVSELGQIPGTSQYRDLEIDDTLLRIPGIRILQLEDSINFANAEHISKTLLKLVDGKHGVKHGSGTDQELDDEIDQQTRTIILCCNAVNDLDTTGLDMLEEFGETCQSKRIQVLFAGWKKRVQIMLCKARDTLSTPSPELASAPFTERLRKRVSVPHQQDLGRIVSLRISTDFAVLSRFTRELNNSPLNSTRWFTTIHDAVQEATRTLQAILQSTQEADV